MDFEADFLVNPLSYILGALSFVGFFIVARNEVWLWLHELIEKRRATRVKNHVVATAEQNRLNAKTQKTSVILGLVFIGMVFSVIAFVVNAKAEQIQPEINLNDFMLIAFAFIMLPGGLAGIAAGAWINATYPDHQSSLLERLLTGMLVYIAYVTLVEFTEIHLLLFLSGPVVTLLVYRFSPGFGQGSPLPM